MDLSAYESRYPLRDLPEGAEVTRIAPSPTGLPHIGTAVQAIINYAVAQKTGGRFILRIEDTDRQRMVEGAVEQIREALGWLGTPAHEGPDVGGDYGPYTQSERLELYGAAAAHLIEQKKAYRCFCTKERLDAVRAEQIANKAPKPMYDRHCRSLEAEEVNRRMQAGEPSVVRLAVPDGGPIEFDEPLRGRISIDRSEVDDVVILKSDGFPTYHLAVVVDDHFMRVTTAVRGEEWISSMPRHVLLYEAFGWTPPRIVHTPLLRDAEKRKLSKRSGDTSLAHFQDHGYLAEGFRNFLTRIIWVHPEGEDVYPFERFIEGFDVGAMSKTGPVADFNLLDFINGQHLAKMDPAQLGPTVVAYYERLAALGRDIVFEVREKRGRQEVPVTRAQLAAFAKGLAEDPDKRQRMVALEPERYRKLSDFIIQSAHYVPELYEAPSAEELIKPLGDASVTHALLSAYADGYDGALDRDAWEGDVRSRAEAADAKAGKLFMLLRLVGTGSTKSPPLYDVLQILGASEVKRRLRLAAERTAEQG